MPEDKSRYWRITMVYAFFAFAGALYNPVFSVYLTQNGIDPLSIGILLSTFSLASVFLTPIIGVISDAVGRKPLILTGIALQVLVALLYVLIQHPLIVTLTRAIDAFSYYAIVLVAVAKLEDIVTDTPNKSQAVGKSLSIAQVGNVLGPLAGGLLADWVSIQFPFYATMGLLMLLFVWYMRMPRTNPTKNTKPLNLNPLPAVKKFISQSSLRGLAVLGMAHQTMTPVILVYLPIYIIQTLHLHFLEVGVAIFLQSAPMLTQFYGGKLSDQLGSRKVMILGSGLVFMGFTIMAVNQTFMGLLIGLLVHGIGTSLWNISSLAFLSQYGEANHEEATYLGSFLSISKIGAFLAYIICGFMVRFYGLNGLFQFLAIVMALAIAYNLGIKTLRERVVKIPLNLIRSVVHWE